jgi:shikimate kinase
MGIILIMGPKHSGKTSAGRILAERSNSEFIDLDAWIESKTGKSPRSLYREGPEVFRCAEAEALRVLLNECAGAARDRGVSYIIAAGGGVIDNDAAMRLLKNTKLTMVCLDINPRTAWDRIRRAARKSGEFPPFLDTADPEGTHRKLHERRAAAYRAAASIVINADNKSSEKIAAEILGACADSQLSINHSS